MQYDDTGIRVQKRLCEKHIFMRPQQTSSPKDPPPSSKHSRFWIFLLLALFFFFGAVYIIWLFLQRPAIGDVRVVQKASTEDRDSAQNPKQYQGKYLTFSYPGVYVEKAHETPTSGPIKESIFLSAADFEGRKIAIVVEEREARDFETSPAFQMRSDKPKEYGQETVSASGFDGFLFKKNTQVFERTFFLHSGDFIISISVTSPISAEGLDQGLFAVISSVRFPE